MLLQEERSLICLLADKSQRESISGERDRSIVWLSGLIYPTSASMSRFWTFLGSKQCTNLISFTKFLAGTTIASVFVTKFTKWRRLDVLDQNITYELNRKNGRG